MNPELIEGDTRPDSVLENRKASSSYKFKEFMTSRKKVQTDLRKSKKYWHNNSPEYEKI